MLILFGLSVLIAVLVGAGLASRGRDPSEKFWIVLGSVALQIGAIAGLTSLVSFMTWPAWLLVQACLYLATRLAGFRLPDAGRLFELFRLASHPGRGESLGPAGYAVILTLTALIAASALQQLGTPINGFDEKMYNASRVLYWIQNQSLLPYETHNDRQVTYPFGAELLFLWPVLFTRTEWIARLVFWLAYPGAVLGFILLAREMGVGRLAALTGALVFASTPLVLYSAVGLKQDLWLTLFFLGLSWWMARLAKVSDPAASTWAWAGVFLLLAANTRVTALAALPVLLLLWLRQARNRARSLSALAAGLLIGAVLSGFLLQTTANLVRHRHPLGPAGLREVVASDLSPKQIYVHTVRFLGLLVEPPLVPHPTLVEPLQNFGRQALALTGATEILPLERADGWPGKFEFTIRSEAMNFSLAGLLWIFCLPITLWVYLLNRRRAEPRFQALCWLLILDLSLLAATLYPVRWMVDSRVPERLLVAPFALGLMLATLLVSELTARRRITSAFCLILVTLAVFPPTVAQFSRWLPAMATDRLQNELFSEVVSLLPANSTILLIGQQNTTDYVLFGPDHGYSNRVISWGKTALNQDDLQARIQKQRVTHVLFQNDVELNFHWDAPLPTRDIVHWVAARPEFQEIPLRTPHMRLFATGYMDGLPAPQCFAQFSDGWHGLEKSGTDWWRWTAREGQLSVLLAADGTLFLRAEIASLAQPNGLELRVDGAAVYSTPIGPESFQPLGPVKIPLKKGRHTIDFVSSLPPRFAPNDDRPLAIAVRNLTIQLSEGGTPCKVIP